MKKKFKFPKITKNSQIGEKSPRDITKKQLFNKNPFFWLHGMHYALLIFQTNHVFPVFLFDFITNQNVSVRHLFLSNRSNKILPINKNPKIKRTPDHAPDKKTDLIS